MISFERQVEMAAIALALLAGAGSALADSARMERCAGIVKAGNNDCATSRNACSGQVRTDRDPEAWIYVPEGTCLKIIGGVVRRDDVEEN